MTAHKGSESCFVVIADTVVAAVCAPARCHHQRAGGHRLVVATSARARRALFCIGAGTAHGHARAPRARQITGCGHRLVVAMLPRAPPALLFSQRRRRARPGAGTAGTSNNRVRASLRRRDVSAGLAGIVFYRRGHRPWPSAGTAGTSNNRVREPRRCRDVSAGTPDTVF